jgi:hypothetical protein
MDYVYVGLMVGFGILSLGLIKLSEKLMENEE